MSKDLNQEERETLPEAGGIWKWGNSSLQRRAGLVPDLQRLADRALILSPVDFGIAQGRRTQAYQDELVAAGKSRNRDSAHLRGLALDFVPYRGSSADYGQQAVASVRNAFEIAAAQLGLELKDPIPGDSGHIELIDRDPKNRIAVSVPGMVRAQRVTPEQVQAARQVLFDPSIRQGEFKSFGDYAVGIETHYDERRGNHRGASVFVRAQG